MGSNSTGCFFLLTTTVQATHTSISDRFAFDSTLFHSLSFRSAFVVLEFSLACPIPESCAILVAIVQLWSHSLLGSLFWLQSVHLLPSPRHPSLMQQSCVCVLRIQLWQIWHRVTGFAVIPLVWQTIPLF